MFVIVGKEIIALPDGQPGQILQTDGNGNLSWASVSDRTNNSGWFYVDRGDPNNYDFRFGYTPQNWIPIQDAQYHELDLSSIVPIGAKRVRLNFVLRATSSLRTFVFRKKGQQNPYNVDGITTQAANVHCRHNVEVNLDNTRIIEYYATAGSSIDMVCIAVVGWWV